MDACLNKTKNIIRLSVVGFLLLVGVALLLFTFFLVLKEPDFEPLAFIALVFASLFLILSMYHTLKINLAYDDADKAILSVTEEGFYDRRITKRTVPWDNVEWRYIVVKGNPSICFNILRNELSYLKKQGFTEKTVSTLSKFFGFPSHTIDLMSLAEKPSKIKAEFEKYKNPM